MNTPPFRCSLSASGLLPVIFFAAVASALGQTAAKQPDDTVQMTPFEVRGGKTAGPYVQEDVVSVTKFAVPIIDVPQNIFVFNRAYLDDLNTGQLRDSMAYNPSIQGGLYSTGGSYRGFSNQEKLKDGFKMSPFFDYDTIHFERIELLKGPSAVMYGRTEPGGITNYVTKAPIQGARYASFTVGTGRNNKNTRQNYNWDINDTFSIAGRNPVSVRITGAVREYQDSRDSQTENGGQQQGSARIAVMHWLTNSTRVYASYMYYRRLFETQFGRYAAFQGANVRLAPNHLIPFSIQYNRDPFEDYGYGREFYWEFNDTQFILDHKIADGLDFRLGFNLHKRTNEDYLLLISPATLDGQGAIAQIGINKNKNDAFFPDVQAHVVWKPGQNHNILIGASQNWAFEDVKQWFQQRNADGTAFRRVYNPAIGIPKSLPADVIYVPTLHTSDPRRYYSLMTNYHGGFLDNRLHIMAGVSYNHVITKFKVTRLRLSPPPKFETDDFNPQFGAIYKITPEISAFGIVSQSTQFTFTRDSFLNYFGPVTGDGFEGGFKFAFRNGHINGTLTYFDVTQSNNVVFDPTADSLLYRQSVAAGFPNPSLRGDNVAAGETNSNGVELEMNAALTPQWSLTFGYAHNDQVYDFNPTLQAGRPLTGTKVVNLEPNKITLFTRYDFSEGRARGLFVNGGLIYIDKVYAGYAEGTTTGQTFWAKGGTRIDASVGYRFKGFGVDHQIRLQGLGINRPVAWGSGYNPATNDRYYLKARPIINLDYTVTF